MTDSCANCRFLVTTPQSAFCRRMPPVIITTGFDPDRKGGLLAKMSTAFPSVRMDWYCFEHRRVLVPANAAVVDERLQGAGEGRA